ncbi:hypothetical protein BT93_F1421 [Corymbia citriodora subsp. variegata]|nr:hypothetical protein BT93_F1421 [Corymbia citriodora subsp. variegata]
MPVVVNLPVSSCFSQIDLLGSFTGNLHLSPFLSPRHLYLHVQKIKLISICGFSGAAMPTSSKTVVEYAKSNRSSCKKCFKTIDKNAVRLGLVSRDSRGFDMTSWHHMNCFPFDSNSTSSTEAIKGFSLLKSSDQESLKRLLGSCKKTLEEIQERNEDEENETKEKHPKKRKIQERDDGEENEAKEGNAAKALLALPEEEDKVEITLSVSAIKDNYKGAKLSPKWKAFETIIFLERDEGLQDSSRIAAFDFDGCLVNTSVKRVGPDAWSLLYSSIPEQLQKLYDEGYKLVIFTNESNIERWKNKRQVAVDSKIGRLNSFIKLVNVPIQVFIACGVGKPSGLAEDPYRKPKTGMWNVMAKYFNSGISIDMDKSFYVGDAAGRINDHSDADIKFAQAIGLKFYLPEEYFQA